MEQEEPRVPKQAASQPCLAPCWAAGAPQQEGGSSKASALQRVDGDSWDESANFHDSTCVSLCVHNIKGDIDIITSQLKNITTRLTISW